MTKNVNLSSFTRIQCGLTRAVKKLKVFISGPVKSPMYLQSREPAMQSSFKKKHVTLCSNKNCQSTRCYKKKGPVKQGSVCSDKNWQETKFIHMWPLKPEMKEKSSYMQLLKPAMKRATYMFNQDDKSCQSAKCVHM